MKRKHEHASCFTDASLNQNGGPLSTRRRCRCRGRDGDGREEWKGAPTNVFRENGGLKNRCLFAEKLGVNIIRIVAVVVTGGYTTR